MSPLRREPVVTCEVVDVGCLSPANLEPPVPVRTECFACGLPVCTRCSRRRSWFGQPHKRICNRCAEDDDRRKGR